MQQDFQMTSQQYRIFWLAEFSQVQDILSPLVTTHIRHLCCICRVVSQANSCCHCHHLSPASDPIFSRHWGTRFFPWSASLPSLLTGCWVQLCQPLTATSSKTMSQTVLCLFEYPSMSLLCLTINVSFFLAYFSLR